MELNRATGNYWQSVNIYKGSCAFSHAFIPDKVDKVTILRHDSVILFYEGRVAITRIFFQWSQNPSWSWVCRWGDPCERMLLKFTFFNRGDTLYVIDSEDSSSNPRIFFHICQKWGQVCRWGDLCVKKCYWSNKMW